MDRAAVDREYDSLVRQVNSQLTAVSKMVEDQRIEAEKERLRRIQEEMEKERLRKEAEERERREEEQRRQL